jgi:hypothetical protein
MTKLSNHHQKIHSRNVDLAQIHARTERKLVESLIQTESEKIHKRLGHASMFLYATKELKLSESVALMLINVARASRKHKHLRSAIAKQKLTPAKASRIVAHITDSSAQELVDFAVTHNYREIDFEMAKRNPKAAAQDRAKPIAEDLVEIKVTISREAYEKLQRAQSLLAQKGKPASLSDAVEASVDQYVYRHDPVQKVKRARARKLCVHRVRPTQAQKNAALARDGGSCTFVDQHGERCGCDRWVDVHHIISLDDGGSNGLENLTTLCWFHHDLVHQLSFKMEPNQMRQ